MSPKISGKNGFWQTSYSHQSQKATRRGGLGEGKKEEWVKENRADVNQMYWKEAPDLLYNTLVGPEILHFTYLLFQDINRR